MLNQELEKPINTSLYRISKKYNFLVETAQRNFPEQCEEIKRRYSIYLAQTKVRRKLEIIDLLHKQLNSELPISLEQLSKKSNYSKKTLKKMLQSYVSSL